MKDFQHFHLESPEWRQLGEILDGENGKSSLGREHELPGGKKRKREVAL